MTSIIHEIIISYGLLAILLLMMTNGIASAPPSELILAVGAIWAASKNIDLKYVVIAASVGNTIGAIILYFIGYRFGLNWLTKIRNFLNKQDSKYLRRTGAILHKIEQLHTHDKFFNDNALLWVGVLRCFPVVRSIVSYPAGVMKMNLFLFITLSVIGIFLWATFWVIIGYLLNVAWVEMKGPSFGVFIALFAILIAVIYRKYKIYSLRLIDQAISPCNQAND